MRNPVLAALKTGKKDKRLESIKRKALERESRLNKEEVMRDILLNVKSGKLRP